MNNSVVAAVLVLVALGLLSGVAGAAGAGSSWTHVFLFDVSGSMREELRNPQTLGFVRDVLLTDPRVILPSEKVIVRAFHAGGGPVGYRPNDPMRLWPSGALAPIGDGQQRAAFASRVLSGLVPTGPWTNLPWGLQSAMADWSALAPGGAGVIWLLTDNWQDEGGDGTSGIQDFYSILASDDAIRSVHLIPLLRSSSGAEGNLVLYIISLAASSVPDFSADLNARIECVAGSGGRYGFLPDALVPIACRGSALQPPKIAASPPPKFTAEACDASLELQGSELDFKDLRLGTPFAGRIEFNFESPLKAWRIQNVNVRPAVFTFRDEPRLQGNLQVSLPVTPPMIDEISPGGKTFTRFSITSPPAGLFTPRMASRTLRDYFPGGRVTLQGDMRLKMDVDVRKNLALDSNRLSSLVDRVRLIDEIYRMAESDKGGGQTVPWRRVYTTKYEIRVDDALSYLGPVLAGLLLALVGALGWILVRPTAVFCRIDEEDETEIKVAFVRSGKIAVERRIVGHVNKRLSGDVVYCPIQPRGHRERLRRVRLARQYKETIAPVGERDYRVRLRLR